MKRHLNDQMLKAIVDEYEQHGVLADRRTCDVTDLALLEHLTIADARKLHEFIAQRQSVL